MTKSYRKYILRTAIVLLWLLLMFGLIRYEAYPQFFTKTISSYRNMLPETVLLQDSWARVIVNGIPAGYTHTSMDVMATGKVENIEIRNKTFVKLSIMGTPSSIRVKSGLLLDPDYNLLSFNAAVSAPGMAADVSGKRSHARIYDVTINFGGFTNHHRLEIPADVLVYSPLTMLALGHLKPGQSVSIKTIDPLSMTPENVIIKAVRRETINLNGSPVHTTLLELNYHGLRLHSWVNSEGLIMRQQTPLGWVIESCSAQQALDAVAELKKYPEISSLKTGAQLMRGVLALPAKEKESYDKD